MHSAFRASYGETVEGLRDEGTGVEESDDSEEPDAEEDSDEGDDSGRDD